MSFNPPKPFPDGVQLTALDRDTRRVIPTCEAAVHLNRRPQTLRIWACRQNGPIRPLNINGRLAWPVAEIRKLLGVPA
ncbi:MAG TPA: DNA-binding protein [Burkholderiaceae bacterium]|nr:DNA-binding protein [Burkholderiaceae bacterium]